MHPHVGPIPTVFERYEEILQLLYPSLLAASAVAIAAGVVGVIVLLRRDALAAVALPHTAALGSAVALRLGINPLPPAMAAVAAAVVLLTWSRRSTAQVAMLPAIYIAALCGSFLIIAGSGQHVAELQAIFTGIDVAVSPEQAVLCLSVLLPTALLVVLFWRRWLLLSQAPATADAAAVPAARWELFFLSLMAAVFILGTASLGVVMVLAMLFLPSATVLPWSRRLPGALIAAAVVGLADLLIGFVLAVESNWPLSQSIGATGFVVMLISMAVAKWRQ